MIFLSEARLLLQDLNSVAHAQAVLAPEKLMSGRSTRRNVEEAHYKHADRTVARTQLISSPKSRSWLLDLPQGGRVLRVATIVLWDVDPTGFVTLGSQQHFQPRPTPLRSRTHPNGLHGVEGTAGLGKEYNSESPQMLLSELA